MPYTLDCFVTFYKIDQIFSLSVQDGIEYLKGSQNLEERQDYLRISAPHFIVKVYQLIPLSFISILIGNTFRELLQLYTNNTGLNVPGCLVQFI